MTESLLRPEPHPLLPCFTDEELDRLLQLPDGADRYAAWLNKRQRKIAKADLDPLNHGWEPDAWTVPDLQLDVADTVAVFGANRTTKSWWAGRRFCEAAMAYTGVMVALSEKDEASIATQQKIVWHYLRPHIEHLNNKRDPKFKVNYTQANGFTEGKLVLPPLPGMLEGTEIYFLTYKQIATDYEGWEFGARIKGKLARRPDGRPIHNVGWWGDESLTIAWLEVLTRRSPFRGAKGLWTFTPVRGITPAIKEFLGSTAEILESAPADLLPQARLHGCPPGHMPTLVKPFHPRSRAVYFHLGANPFGDYTAEVRRLCDGKTVEFIERVAYGYARDAVNRAFPDFGPWNVVKIPHVPEEGTVYQFTDPHGLRPFATMWVLATPGKEPDYYILRDWPSEQEYGEWAVNTEREVSEDTRKGWDGDPGPAQNPLGWGVPEYKQLWRRLETIHCPPALKNIEGELSDEQLTGALKAVPSPWHRPLLRTELKAGSPTDELREQVRTRFMDARFANAAHAGEHGGTCLKWDFGKEQRNSAGVVVGPKVNIEEASGQHIDHGLVLVSNLLAWNRAEPLMPGMNAPKLYVAENCRQVIWALSNYTGRAGETGACKEWIDLCRHLAEEAPRHIAPGPVRTRGGGMGY